MLELTDLTHGLALGGVLTEPLGESRVEGLALSEHARGYRAKDADIREE